MAAQFDNGNIVNILKNHKSVKGVNLYDHLISLFHNLINQKSTEINEFRNFESFSDYIKKNQFVYQNPRDSDEVNNILEKVGDFKEWIQKSHNLFKTQKKSIKPLGVVDNLVSIQSAFEWAGLSLGEEETYRIQQSIQVDQIVKIKQLSRTSNASYMRFWGKILGSKNDYYVAEGKVSQTFADEAPSGSEKQGTGCNSLTYWVCHSGIFKIKHKVLDEWVELPLVTPQQINVTRQVKYTFTGNLYSKIDSYPSFDGLEKHFLKAQIVRISNSSHIVPRGIYKTNDENPADIEFEEEPKMPEFSDLSNPENWVHLHPQILNAGRITHLEPDLPEEEKLAKLDELNGSDPVIERLKGINEDRPYEGFETNWLVRTCGSDQVYNGKDDGASLQYGVVSLKSITWPGTLTVATANKYQTIYIGYGYKNGQVSFNPMSPDNVPEDPEDQNEQPEPNPKDIVDEVEPDSDNEGKENEEEAE